MDRRLLTPRPSCITKRNRTSDPICSYQSVPSLFKSEISFRLGNARRVESRGRKSSPATKRIIHTTLIRSTRRRILNALKIGNVERIESDTSGILDTLSAVVKGNHFVGRIGVMDDVEGVAGYTGWISLNQLVSFWRYQCRSRRLITMNACA
jgi:hypothetical protein